MKRAPRTISLSGVRSLLGLAQWMDSMRARQDARRLGVALGELQLEQGADGVFAPAKPRSALDDVMEVMREAEARSQKLRIVKRR